MINHPNRSQSTYRPNIRPAHKDWGYVAHGLDNGQHFVRGSLGYPVPDWSNGEMRVRLGHDTRTGDTGNRLWIIEAKVADGQVIPASCKMV